MSIKVNFGTAPSTVLLGNVPTGEAIILPGGNCIYVVTDNRANDRTMVVCIGCNDVKPKNGTTPNPPNNTEVIVVDLTLTVEFRRLYNEEI